MTDDDNFGMALEVNRQEMLDTRDACDVCGDQSGKQQGAVNYVALANHWQIPLHKAKNMVQQTTQCGMRAVLHPTLQIVIQ